MKIKVSSGGEWDSYRFWRWERPCCNKHVRTGIGREAGREGDEGVVLWLIKPTLFKGVNPGGSSSEGNRLPCTKVKMSSRVFRLHEGQYEF